jgi:hypothetical protein
MEPEPSPFQTNGDDPDGILRNSLHNSSQPLLEVVIRKRLPTRRLELEEYKIK